MDALHPRLLVDRFAETFRFYQAVLPELAGAELTRGTADGPYASWDVAGQGTLALFDRTALAAALGTDSARTEPAGSGVMFVCRVDDVDAGYHLCLLNGAVPVAAPADRPQWGPGLRTAHLRDPEGTLVELQSY
ncbi:VOC family protein [Kitasatospora sp. DSM 101779]|uniref:VOC family protein n=1 Tax=Kitasatospora sp. DSM 101779 TaxID=2853165 RepID=UPI0021DACF36|nr:VOC family protein [Kitasatospora sp. DSM 101779]MCU7827032.1 glyoxalase/bleomycin resistance/extradiol dioxygenase family protein [Kitasatospora sp. DSM 101779]